MTMPVRIPANPDDEDETFPVGPEYTVRGMGLFYGRA
jgi:hypothetical protein